MDKKTQSNRQQMLDEQKRIREVQKQQQLEMLNDVFDDDPVKFREWFSIKGIISELRQVSWPRPAALLKGFAGVTVFAVLLAALIYGYDTLLIKLLSLLG